MDLDFSSINWLAVLVAAVAAFVIGFLWHGPLFGKQWIKLMGIPKAEVDKMRARGMGPMVPHMIGSFVQQIVIAAVLAYFADALGVAGAGEAVMLGFLVWLGFVATILFNTVLWENRKFNLYLFNVVYHLVSFVVISLIVVQWQ